MDITAKVTSHFHFSSGLHPVCDWLRFLAAGRAGQPAPTTHCCQEGGWLRARVSVGEHVRPLPETARVSVRGAAEKQTDGCHSREGLSFELIMQACIDSNSYYNSV